jgi:hypothetical protein
VAATKPPFGYSFDPPVLLAVNVRNIIRGGKLKVKRKRGPHFCSQGHVTALS